MEYLFQFFSTLAGDPERARWLVAITIGLAVALFGLSIFVLISGIFDPFRRRMHAVAGSETGVGPSASVDLMQTFKPLTQYLVPTNEAELSGMRAKMVQAGFRSPNSVTNFYAIKFIFIIACPALVVAAATLFPRFSTAQVMYAAMFASGIGLLLPSMYLSHRVESRRRSLMNALPDALDLLVTCTEAGLGLNQALQRVADEIDVSHPDLAEELALVNAEIGAGVERTDALRGLANRTGLEEIRGLVSLMSQSMRFGTSIADTLRIYSEEYREKRMQRAEEQAAKISTKLIFPLVFCLWPSFFIVAVAPAVLGALRAIQPILK